MSTLMIVESPAKAKKIQKFLQHKDIVVLSSYGHITNLNTDKLEEMIHNNFTPLYKNLNWPKSGQEMLRDGGMHMSFMDVFSMAKISVVC